MKHIHQEKIIEWANGAEIEIWKELIPKWVDDKNPDWNPKSEYRIKPKPRKNINFYAYISESTKTNEKEFFPHANVKYTFDDNKLIDVELLK